jgi:hypothetical protein
MRPEISLFEGTGNSPHKALLSFRYSAPFGCSQQGEIRQIPCIFPASKENSQIAGPPSAASNGSTAWPHRPFRRRTSRRQLSPLGKMRKSNSPARHAQGAHAFLGYNRALLGNAGETLPAIERAMRYRSASQYLIVFWRIFRIARRPDRSGDCLAPEIAIPPMEVQSFLIVVLSDAMLIAESFRRQYSKSPVNAFERLWLSRSASPVYRTQVFPLFENIQCSVRHPNRPPKFPIQWRRK